MRMQTQMWGVRVETFNWHYFLINKDTVFLEYNILIANEIISSFSFILNLVFIISSCRFLSYVIKNTAYILQVLTICSKAALQLVLHPNIIN